MVVYTQHTSCLQKLHCALGSDSWISEAYDRTKIRAGKKKAKIAAARKLLVTMYCMLKEGRKYHA